MEFNDRRPAAALGAATARLTNAEVKVRRVDRGVHEVKVNGDHAGDLIDVGPAGDSHHKRSYLAQPSVGSDSGMGFVNKQEGVRWLHAAHDMRTNQPGQQGFTNEHWDYIDGHRR